MKHEKLAETLGCRLEGDGSIEIAGVAGLEDARADQVTFLSNPRYSARVSETKAGAARFSSGKGRHGDFTDL